MMRGVLSGHAQRVQPSPRSGVPWSVVLPWVVTAAVLVVTAFAIFWPRPVEGNPAAPGQPGLLVWGDAVFANPLELEAWLRIRGVSYAQWARRHPAAVKILTDPPARTAPAPAAPNG
jgi:hypothetical protein